MSLRQRLEDEVEKAAGGVGLRARLAPALRETILAAPAGTEELVEFYGRRLPREWAEQLTATDAGARLLWRRDLELPRLEEGIAGLRRVLGDGFAGDGGSVLERYRPTLFGSCAPLVGALAPERDAWARELAPGREAEVVDRVLSGNLLHEICHGRPVEMDAPPAPWTMLEGAALLLGARARPGHVFPDVAGEAVRGVSLFVLAGEGLARIFGLAALARLLSGAPLPGVVGERAAGVLAAAGWQAWLKRRTPPFVADALDAEAWIKLADGLRRPEGLVVRDPAGEAARLPDLLGEAERTPWAALPWHDETPGAEDLEMVRTGVTAMFQANVMSPTFQTVPCDPPGGEIFIDVADCRIHARPRPEGVFGEPARWLLPPPLARRLAERGARRVVVLGATRARREAIAAALVELSLGVNTLASDHVLDFRA